MTLAKERFDYVQVNIAFINLKLPNYVDKSHKEIRYIVHIIILTEDLAREQSHNFQTKLSYKNKRLNCKG